ncbi:tetratricopeptide repeat protein [Kiloniella sp.]|uniref:tetratricopeptide repeat protein n=1 Tax=Kiloniella sp. TaxID=1938587 RepID=UPI003B01EDEB
MPFVKDGKVIKKTPGLSVEFTLKPGMSARLFSVGPKSVVDVKVADKKEQPTVVEASKSKPAPATPTVTTKPAPPKVAPGDPVADENNTVAAVKLPKLEELAGPGPLSLLPKPDADEKKESASVKGPVETQKTESQVENKPLKKESKPARKKRLEKISRSGEGATRLSDFKLVDDDGVDSGASTNALAQDLVTLTEPIEIPALVPPPGRSADLLPPTILNFNWKEPTGAVVFRRGEYLWLVFDREGPENLANAVEAMAPQFAPVNTLPLAGGTVLRLSAPVTQVPRLSKDGNKWIVDIRRRSPLPVQVISNVLGKGKDGPEVRFLVKSVSRLLSISHPELGDRLIVAPIREPNLGSAKIDEFPQFRALPSFQGVVLQPTSEGLVVALTPRAVVVRSREELIVSGDTERSLPRGVEGAAIPTVEMLDLNSDRRGGADRYLQNLQALQKSVVNSTGLQQGLARFDLARFFFAHGRITEALGILHLIEQENRRLSDGPSFKLLLGASQFLSDNFIDAQKTLSNSALAGEREANLWQAALAASGQDWGPAAIGFSETSSLIEDFPQNVRNKLYLLAADASLHVGDTGAASLYLGKILASEMTDFEKAQADFLEGQRLLQDGQVEEARVIWKGLKYNRHRPTSARARHALTKLGIEEGAFTKEEGIEQLEQLRFAWRGDKFEFAILSELGDRYADALDYRNSLHSLRQAASYFPHSERADNIARRMKELFESMYIEDGGRKIPPLSSIALYEEFKELTPLGDKGDTMIAKLADRLVDVDLLEQAGNLLDEQVEFRLEGQEKARVGNRLSLIRLLDRDPEGSLAALDKTEVEDIPEELKQQRFHLRARALAELGQEDEALKMLEADVSLDALRLKSDILWDLRRWNEAGKMLENLIPASPPEGRLLNEEESQGVINLAIAQTMSGDNEGLKLLRDSYDAIMSDGPQGDTFKLLTGNIDSGAVTSISDELKQVSQVQAFMDQYRDRLKTTPLSEIN